MNRRALILGFSLLLAGCASAPVAQNGKPVLLGYFKGTLPCADCPGITTELTLYQKDQYTAEGNYILKETYLDRSVEPRVKRGEWTTSRGTPKDDDATVYQLEPDDLKKSSYYLKVDERHIRQLDKDENEIQSQLNFTLTKQ